MLRTIIAFAATLTLIAIVTVAAGHVAAQREQARPPALTRERAAALDDERPRWLASRHDSVAGAEVATEARRTLDLLDELYRQEARLWSYYDALERSHATRERMIAERQELEHRVAEQRRQLERLDHRLRQLRPLDKDSITFDRAPEGYR